MNKEINKKSYRSQNQKHPIDYSLLKQLFYSMFALSACTFGGGFVIVSLMKKKVVEEHHWLEEDEMLDVTAIAQSSPGPIPVNASVILGYRLHGIIGALVAVAGTILPPMLLLSLIAVFYDQFRSNPIITTALTVMRAGVAAVIFDVVINLAKNVLTTKRTLYIALMIITFVMGYFFDISAMIIIIACLATGIICVFLEKNNASQQ
ncbi:MAG: chromate transporter [Lachnospiraceae bacterium]|nr:chromate transporter [Lachnospiraceae bacterium]